MSHLLNQLEGPIANSGNAQMNMNRPMAPSMVLNLMTGQHSNAPQSGPGVQLYQRSTIQTQLSMSISMTMTISSQQSQTSAVPMTAMGANMQLYPKQLVSSLVDLYLKKSRKVVFQFTSTNEALETLNKVMSNELAGCVHFSNSQFDIGVMILLYAPEKRAYIGFIPTDQTGLVSAIRMAITSYNNNLVVRQQQQIIQQGAPNQGHPQEQHQTAVRIQHQHQQIMHAQPGAATNNPQLGHLLQQQQQAQQQAQQLRHQMMLQHPAQISASGQMNPGNMPGNMMSQSQSMQNSGTGLFPHDRSFSQGRI